ncbi:DUF2589 domain-containing protein [Halioxenophilus sp. WMMB6]|uniref:DUF2589 domain-containing protein n=1 Tax=Halioxenophilus sp. WMMB6 TaxID=3073815 RepID=UPI00295F5A59|nr:DUF2589 domain-containing protein [Halioxenophilus sp. WMMB6]
MPDATKALNSIPFGTLIGGPMNAAVEAQAKAAMTTVDFINAVGFTDGQGGKQEVTNITFTVKKGESTTDIKVPLLTIVPIPFLRIDDMTINFKANITQSEESEDKSSATQNWGVNAKASAGWLWGKASMSASYSSKKDSSSTRDSKYSVEHTVDVTVHAVQDDVPGGLARILNILTKTIEEPTPGKETTPPN